MNPVLWLVVCVLAVVLIAFLKIKKRREPFLSAHPPSVQEAWEKIKSLPRFKVSVPDIRKRLKNATDYHGASLSKEDVDEVLERWKASKPTKSGIKTLFEDPSFIVAVKYVALEDDRTCEFCKSHNDDILLISDPRLLDNMPPIHLGCRCSLMPIFSGELKKGTSRWSSSVPRPDWDQVCL